MNKIDLVREGSDLSSWDGRHMQSNIANLFTPFGHANLVFVAFDLPTVCFANWVRS